MPSKFNGASSILVFSYVVDSTAAVQGQIVERPNAIEIDQMIMAV